MQSGKQGVVALEEGSMYEELKSWLGLISSDCRGGGCGTFSTLMARPCRFESSRYLMASSCSCRHIRHGLAHGTFDLNDSTLPTAQATCSVSIKDSHRHPRHCTCSVA